MKTLLTLCFLVIMTGLQAQPILNRGFENWNSNSGYPLPDNWWSEGGTITQTNNAFAGTSAVSIQGFLGCGISPGILVNGAMPSNFNILYSGTACSVKPISITGRYMFDGGNGSDSAEVSVILKKYNSNTQRHDTVAFGKLSLGLANAYTPFTVNVADLQSGIAPDSMVIVLNSSKHNTWDTINYAMPLFHVDELQFNESLDGIKENKSSMFSTVLQPNPFTTDARLVIKNDISSLGELTLKIVDLTGKEVLNMEGINNNVIWINRNGMASGTYFYRLENKDGLIASGKLIAQ